MNHNDALLKSYMTNPEIAVCTTFGLSNTEFLATKTPSTPKSKLSAFEQTVCRNLGLNEDDFVLTKANLEKSRKLVESINE